MYGVCLCAHVYEKFGGEKWLSGSWEMGFSALLCPTKFSDLIFVAVVFLLVSFGMYLTKMNIVNTCLAWRPSNFLK